MSAPAMSAPTPAWSTPTRSTPTPTRSSPSAIVVGVRGRARIVPGAGITTAQPDNRSAQEQCQCNSSYSRFFHCLASAVPLPARAAHGRGFQRPGFYLCHTLSDVGGWRTVYPFDNLLGSVKLPKLSRNYAEKRRLESLILRSNLC